MAHDLVIRGGLIVDGTGSPGRVGDVAVPGGRIAEVGAVSGRGAREVDAGGLVGGQPIIREGRLPGPGEVSAAGRVIRAA
jgi:N-acyl-D-aspartate/D-glutamate deacylase